jgi:tetratricopeptide (TPR) repeat protein
LEGSNVPKKEPTDKILTRAKKAANAGDFQTAVTAFGQVLARFPSNKRALQGMAALRATALPQLQAAAQQAQEERRWPDAEAQLRAACLLAPDQADMALALAACLMEQRKAPAALAAVQTILKKMPDHPQALNIQGAAQRLMGQGAAAKQSFTAALGDPVWDVQSLNNLGISARAEGARTDAAEYYRRAIAADPDNPALHLNLSQETNYSADTPHLQQMRDLLASKDRNNPALAPLHFALFKAFDDLGETDMAFAHLEKANTLAKANLQYDFQKDAIPCALSKVLLKEPIHSAEVATTQRPIFITGLPRTGTTLAEQILARSEGTHPCGELTVVQLAVVRLMREVMDRPQKALTQSDIDDLGAELRSGLAEYGDGAAVLIDKMPLNFRWIGFICAALPEARIVHMSRDPMAVAWSLYRQSFDSAGNGFVYDPSDIARFMALHRDLMTHWRNCYPDRIFDLSYEALVSNPETTTRALATATGLDWSENWLTPEKASHLVLTASARQIRKPIYRDSNDQWARYEAQLAPMRAAMVAAGLI